MGRPDLHGIHVQSPFASVLGMVRHLLKVEPRSNSFLAILTQVSLGLPTLLLPSILKFIASLAR